MVSQTRLELSDQDILLRLTNTEDSTVERKTANDYRDCLKTAVAFSNSLPVDDPGIICVGVRDNGTVEDNINLESLQNKVSAEIRKVYPAIYPQMKALKDARGKDFLAVIVRGSLERPHFSGPSYVRDGEQTKEASESQFTRLIAERTSKVREILKWRGKPITFLVLSSGSRHLSTGSTSVQIVVDCNQFFVTLRSGAAQGDQSFSLSDIDIMHDYQVGCLMLRLLI